MSKATGTPGLSTSLILTTVVLFIFRATNLIGLDWWIIIGLLPAYVGLLYSYHILLEIIYLMRKP